MTDKAADRKHHRAERLLTPAEVTSESVAEVIGIHIRPRTLTNPGLPAGQGHRMKLSAAESFLQTINAKLRQDFANDSQIDIEGLRLRLKQRRKDMREQTVRLGLRENDPTRGDVAPGIFRMMEDAATAVDLDQDALEKGRALGGDQLYPVLRHHADLVCKLIKERWAAPNFSFTVGMIPVVTPNALALASTGIDEPIVVFQEGLPRYLNRLLKIVTMLEAATPPKDYESIVNRRGEGYRFGKFHHSKSFTTMVEATLDKHPQIELAFLDTMASYVLAGMPQGTLPLASDAYSAIHRGALLQGTYLFLLGHEAAHIVNGDLNEGAGRTFLSLGSSLVAHKPGFAQEYAADELAFEVMVAGLEAWLDRSPLIFMNACCAPDIFFSFIDVLYAHVAIAGKRKYRPVSDTHPTPDERRKVVREKFLPSVYNDWTSSLTSPGVRCEEILAVLVRRTQPAFLKLAEMAGGPFPIWERFEPSL